MNRSHWIVSAVLLAAPIAFTLSSAHEFFSVDWVLDAGASYDYGTAPPDFTKGHPFIPFSERHPTLVKITTGSILGVIVCTVVVMMASRKRHVSYQGGAGNWPTLP
jgi:hypothetical protein